MAPYVGDFVNLVAGLSFTGPMDCSELRLLGFPNVLFLTELIDLDGDNSDVCDVDARV